MITITGKGVNVISMGTFKVTTLDRQHQFVLGLLRIVLENLFCCFLLLLLLAGFECQHWKEFYPMKILQ